LVAVVVLASACAHSAPTVAPEPAVAVTTAVPSGIQQSTPPTAPPATSVEHPATGRDSLNIDPSAVTKRAAEVFGKPCPDSLATADATAVEPSWDIDVHSYESTDRVEHYVQLFAGSARERIEARLNRGTRYEPMIRTKLREGGLPEDMYYLALIESGFDPNAYSRAAAVGMWQFMTSTARDVGLRVDWWVDERRDPMKSTVGAVRFIKGLNEQFGSLYLAAAAYNGGPGRIARGLTRYADDLEGTTGDDLFFALAEKDYLRNETREYVPQLIAAALIAKEPEKYGMKITPEQPISYDSVRVGPFTPLAAVARAANATVADVQDLNPHILRGLTPPKDSFFVRVPTGAADSFPAAFAALSDRERLGVSRVETHKGESLESLADKNGISARQLSLYNPGLKRLKSGRLVVGQSILIPTEAVAAAAAPVPDPAIERYSSTPATTMHVVKSGETLTGLAKRYHTSTSALMKRNGLRRALIFPGQSLVVAGPARSVTTRSSSPKKHVASQTKTASRKSSLAAKKSTSKKTVAAKKSVVSKPAASSKKPTPVKAKVRAIKKKTSVAKDDTR
jgi:membrane-bound lytic murein transglycosylase D